MELKELGKIIKQTRVESGLSQEQLSMISNIERGQLSKIESGNVSGVTFVTIDKILNALGKSFDVKNTTEKKSLDLHPFVKWAGGKTQLLDIIEKHLPASFNRYFEPFIGGGALFFKLKPEVFSINDSNEDLIMTFRCFQDDTQFIELKNKLEEHEKNHSEEYYLKIRNLDRDGNFSSLSSTERAARLIYLNKSCFNGLYRVNSKGQFNVPSGKKKIVKCFDRENFNNLRLFFKNRKGIISCTDFEDAVKNAKKGDFVYFDPPYDNFENKQTFTSYSKLQFGKDEQIRLSNLYKKLNAKGVYVMLSNHNTALVNELYKEFHITVVKAKRAINSKGDCRGFVEEVLITNYE